MATMPKKTTIQLDTVAFQKALNDLAAKWAKSAVGVLNEQSVMPSLLAKAITFAEANVAKKKKTKRYKNHIRPRKDIFISLKKFPHHHGSLAEPDHVPWVFIRKPNKKFKVVADKPIHTVCSCNAPPKMAAYIPHNDTLDTLAPLQMVMTAQLNPRLIHIVGRTRIYAHFAHDIKYAVHYAFVIHAGQCSRCGTIYWMLTRMGQKSVADDPKWDNIALPVPWSAGGNPLPQDHEGGFGFNIINKPVVLLAQMLQPGPVSPNIGLTLLSKAKHPSIECTVESTFGTADKIDAFHKTLDKFVGFDYAKLLDSAPPALPKGEKKK